ncbi:MAG: ParB/RepB/Spo0J family partition protein [Erysipelotrichaceae bacterium]|nr:ParB/RepB/Spo0J family partition protein [Erysipelotrichaceae bacterium]
MAKKKSLNKGLSEIFGADIDSFINDVASGDQRTASSASEIDIGKIRPNPYQPRKAFDDKGLEELAASIRENGVFQPVLVRESIGGYELVAGERRLRASKLAGKQTIPAIVVDFNDQQVMEVSLLENIQRKDLTPIEEANAYDQLIKKFGYTQEQLAKRLGKSRTNVTNLLRLLNLPDKVRKMVDEGKLSYGQARTLLAVEDEEKMLRIAEKTIEEGLSVRQLEKLCSKPQKGPKKEPKETDPFMEDVRIRMQRRFATKVEIQNKSIIIRYNDTDDLNRILEIMGVIEE